MHSLGHFTLIGVLTIVCSTLWSAEPLVIATWNMEHLNEANDIGCVPRTNDDYEYVARRIHELKADVVAIQEIESAAAAYRVFPKADWNVIMSDRPNNRGSDRGPICRGMQDKRLRHQATGIAVRRDVHHQAHASFANLAGNKPNQRWGTDVTIKTEKGAFRVLSVHLASGCWGQREDQNVNRSNICSTLQTQVAHLVDWIHARNKASEAFVVLGDFNRRLAVAGDWAAEELLAPALATTLVTATLRVDTEKVDWCDARYPDLIDHILVSNTLSNRVIAEATKEHPRMREHPDHCIISTAIN